MITIFAVPKPFVGHIGIIQRNAVMNWKKLRYNPEIILLGDELGTKEICKELDLKHIPNLKVNEYGTPYCNDIFKKAQESSKYYINSYINSDIILTNSFCKTALRFKKYEHFLLIGRRYDLEVTELIDYENPHWEYLLKKDVKKRGRLHNHTGIDYFVFRKLDWLDIPPLVIGRIAWDNWLVSQAGKRGHITIDGSKAIFVVHQSHEYKQLENMIPIQKGPEAKENRKIADAHGGIGKGSISNTAYEITKTKRIIRCQ